MNPNQDTDIEELFKRINKSIQRNDRSRIVEDDLNKVRAYVVQSQRPLQAVRLLEKEREERETEENFGAQKEDIIARARELDGQRQQYKEEQQKMILDVTAKTAILQQNSMKRKNEEEKLTKEKLAILRKQKEIEGLEQKLAERQASLASEEEDLKRHKIFTNFLQAVIIDKSGDNETFSGLEDLQNRFTSLKGENEHLRRRKEEINREADEARAAERRRLNHLQASLYEQQRQMQTVQSELEVLSSRNSLLEQEFENEIYKKNKNSTEIGQVINAINNVFNICVVQQEKRGKKLGKQDIKIHEGTEDLVEALLMKLDRSHQTVDELVKVYREYGGGYNREQAYREEIDVQIARILGRHGVSAANTQKSGNQGPSALGGEQIGSKTGKGPSDQKPSGNSKSPRGSPKNEKE